MESTLVRTPTGAELVLRTFIAWIPASLYCPIVATAESVSNGQQALFVMAYENARKAEVAGIPQRETFRVVISLL